MNFHIQNSNGNDAVEFFVYTKSPPIFKRQDLPAIGQNLIENFLKLKERYII
jgi:hypothetical protein